MIFTLISAQVFGKTMENVRNRVDIKVCRAVEEKKKILKLVAKPTFKRFVIFGETDGTCSSLWTDSQDGEPDADDSAWAIPGITEDVDASTNQSSRPIVGIENSKIKVTLCKPIYVGMSILDIAKHLMYDFYYSHLKCFYKNHVRLVYTDTDSLILHIHTDDLYDDLQKTTELYDFSNYPSEHPLFSLKNHRVPGTFKDELGGSLMTEFIGIRAKAYSYTGEVSGARAKGVKKSVLQKTISHDDYRKCLFNNNVITRNMTNIRSHSHRVFGESTAKVALSPLDTKRFILNDGTTTLAYGHKDTPIVQHNWILRTASTLVQLTTCPYNSWFHSPTNFCFCHCSWMPSSIKCINLHPCEFFRCVKSRERMCGTRCWEREKGWLGEGNYWQNSY